MLGSNGSRVVNRSIASISPGRIFLLAILRYFGVFLNVKQFLVKGLPVKISALLKSDFLIHQIANTTDNLEIFRFYNGLIAILQARPSNLVTFVKTTKYEIMTI